MLKLRRIAVDTHRENIAYLSRACGQYHAEEFLALAKVEVIADSHRIQATLNIVDDPVLLGPDELGLSEEAFRLFGRGAGTPVAIEHPPPVDSLEMVRAKIQGRALDAGAYAAVVRDIAARRYLQLDIAAFLVACPAVRPTEEVLHPPP